MKRLRIAFLEDDTADGGLGMVFRNLAKELSKYNEILYISHRPEKSETKEYSRYVKLDFKSKYDEEVNGPVKCLAGVLPLVRIVKEEKPDIIISFGFYSNLRVCLAGRFFRETKILISERGNAKRFRGMVLKTVSGIFRRANGFVFQSKAAQAVFPSYIVKKSSVIYNAVFKKIPQRGSEARNNNIVSVGRFHPDKNFLLLIDAFAAIAAGYPAINLAIYGEEEKGSTLGYKQAMIDRIHLHGLTDRIVLPGQFADVLSEIMNARMFVLSSDLEGMPNALVEAMACGLPVISTEFDPGNAPEFVENGVNGLLVGYRDCTAMANAMRKYLDDYAFAEQMGKYAVHVKNELSKERIFKKWITYIHEICG